MRLLSISSSLLSLLFISVIDANRRSRVTDEADGDVDVDAYDYNDQPWYENALEGEELTVDAILQCNKEEQNFMWPEKEDYTKDLEVLGYVTPWHSKGYAIAESTPALTYTSPVWYQIRSEGKDKSKLVLTGGHGYDGDWIERVRKASSLAMDQNEKSESCTASASGNKIIPRVIWEVRTQFVQQQDIYILTNLLSKEAKAKGYDGYVLEFPINDILIDRFLPALRKALESGGKEKQGTSTIIVAIPQYQMPLGKGPKELHLGAFQIKRLVQAVDRLSLMTYDHYENAQRFPNAPLSWMKDNVVSIAGRNPEVLSKILIGISFYGFDNGEPIIASNLIDRLESNEEDGDIVEVLFETEAKEHAFVLRDAEGKVHVLPFPTPLFVIERLKLAQNLGVAGVAIWELGQGLGCLPRLL